MICHKLQPLSKNLLEGCFNENYLGVARLPFPSLSIVFHIWMSHWLRIKDEICIKNDETFDLKLFVFYSLKFTLNLDEKAFNKFSA